ncbi:cell division protein FtsQ/DivIB [Paenibacillus sp. 32O-W]|uniref:cell division protein FtsQ/DivIB n=1 Tax=Paenibacillus sp. 32O-W TaxID=1695218 RepID=UPI001C92C396|nr:FtsQ-type POTRA domain-containing protein [Paenibacillus sp. 32O-W]
MTIKAAPSPFLTVGRDEDVLQPENQEGVKLSVELKVPAIKPERPRRSGGRRLIALLVVFFLTVLAILFFQSSISKISVIEISGNEMVPSEQIGQASNIQIGDSFFLIDTHRTAELIRSLDMIEEVEITKNFPGEVTIKVKEYKRVAYQINADGEREALLADGSAFPIQDRPIPLDKPILSGWANDNPMKLKLCAVLADIPDPLLADISEIVPEPTAAYEDKIRIYTKSQYEVSTRIQYLQDKLQYLGVLIAEWREQGVLSGELILMEQDRGIPFDNNENSKASKGQKDAKKR